MRAVYAAMRAIHAVELFAHICPARLLQTVSAMTLLEAVKVLLVEDHDDTRQMYAEVLAMLGADVVAVARVSDGLERLTEFKPHVVISDIDLGVPAIAVTGRNVRQQALDGGFALYLMKPVDPFVLGVEVARLTRAKGRLDSW